ncbi:unnamed protein product [Protopolystoma xenopodis]|uniref:Uncharacterized protein n=1 Tax=Protopolystoma xenopodis TaxID=117903 RepID=A0A448XKK9_9PLAT|nr:unnamed protein product [Protopolystoma xenopodis]
MSVVLIGTEGDYLGNSVTKSVPLQPIDGAVLFCETVGLDFALSQILLPALRPCINCIDTKARKAAAHVLHSLCELVHQSIDPTSLQQMKPSLSDQSEEVLTISKPVDASRSEISEERLAVTAKVFAQLIELLSQLVGDDNLTFDGKRVAGYSSCK